MAPGEIIVPRCTLNLKMMLEGGQCFRWKGISECEWIGTVRNAVWSIKQFDDHIEYHVKAENSGYQDHDAAKRFLCSYLRLDEPVENYYEEWSRVDPNFKKVASKCYGIRILNQDPIENIFSFICSSNNNIKRISSLVEKLCTLYGEKLGVIDGINYHSFPGVSALADAKEADLRTAGFGYRAKFICESAKQLKSLGGAQWLENLMNVPYPEAKSQLMKFPGIGAKVADCICLMSLGHMEALPVDTHVYQIASQVYLPDLKRTKTVTDKVYNLIGSYFRSLYGPRAGWAHTVLFCGDLKAFKDFEPSLSSDSNEISEAKKQLSNATAKLSRQNNKRQSRECESEGGSVSGILKCPRKDLHLNITLNSGQTYRFKELEKDVWRGVFASKVWILKQFDENIEFTAYFSNDYKKRTKRRKHSGESDEDYCRNLLYDYFRLDVPLSEHYTRWAQSDQHFKEISEKFFGLRMIKQDIVENLFTFICSSCNTISRMTAMVETMCNLYGDKIADVDQISYFDFPSINMLSMDYVEKDLVKHNFGYRAKYVQQAAKYIMKNGGDSWFDNLKKMSYEEAKYELMKLPGIAAKVADCICLTALNHLETIPVDTHVFQIAKRYYLPHLNGKKTISDKTYHEIGNSFRNIFGKYAGWAHTVLFASDLRQHKEIHSKGK